MHGGTKMEEECDDCFGDEEDEDESDEEDDLF